jgi:hypothetical protein
MGSPFISQYRLALLVERLPDGSYRVRAAPGFHYATGLACFENSDTKLLTPEPAGARIIRAGRQLCVK